LFLNSSSSARHTVHHSIRAGNAAGLKKNGGRQRCTGGEREEGSRGPTAVAATVRLSSLSLSAYYDARTGPAHPAE
jgi:hypothetical protein